MKAAEIFEKSVFVMKGLMTNQGMTDSLKRARARSEEENVGLLARERERINEIVRKVVESGGSGEPLAGVSEELKDALVLRYLKNRDLFMKTFPDGLDDVDSEPVSLWASIMISPLDDGMGG